MPAGTVRWNVHTGVHGIASPSDGKLKAWTPGAHRYGSASNIKSHPSSHRIADWTFFNPAHHDQSGSSRSRSPIVLVRLGTLSGSGPIPTRPFWSADNPICLCTILTV